MKPSALARLRAERARLAELLAWRRKRHEAGGSVAVALVHVTHDLIRAEIAEARRIERAGRLGRKAEPRRAAAATADLFAA